MRSVDLGLIPAGPRRAVRGPVWSKLRAEQDPAITAVVYSRFDEQTEILVIPTFGIDVADMRPGADDDAILDPPIARLTWVRLPPGQVFSVEQRYPALHFGLTATFGGAVDELSESPAGLCSTTPSFRPDLAGALSETAVLDSPFLVWIVMTMTPSATKPKSEAATAIGQNARGRAGLGSTDRTGSRTGRPRLGVTAEQRLDRLRRATPTAARPGA